MIQIKHYSDADARFLYFFLESFMKLLKNIYFHLLFWICINLFKK